MPARHVPVEIFGLDVERENVGQQDAQRAGNITDGIVREIGRGPERGRSRSFGIHD
jgi:hypothetical protein